MFDLLIGIDGVRRRTEGSIAVDQPVRAGRSASSRRSFTGAVSTLAKRVLAAPAKPAQKPSGHPPVRGARCAEPEL